MGTVVVLQGDVFVQAQCGLQESDTSVVLDVVCRNKGLNAEETQAVYIRDELTTNQFRKIKDISSGQIIDREESVSEKQEKAIATVTAKYSKVCAGLDPETGAKIYVDCETTIGTFRMNAGRDAYTRMREGVQSAQETGKTEMPRVRDFYNVNHGPDEGTNYVSFQTACEIYTKQGEDAINHWNRKIELVDTIKSAVTAQGVSDIDLTFAVNTES